MKKWKIAILAVVLMATGASAAEVDTRTWLQADELDLAKYQGEVVLVDFWASWCLPCKESIPWLSELQERYGERGLQVIAVNLDQKLSAAGPMSEGLHREILLVHDPDGTLAHQHDLQGMPSAFLYDREGQLAASHIGFLAAEVAEKEAEIVELLGPAEKETSSE